MHCFVPKCVKTVPKPVRIGRGVSKSFAPPVRRDLLLTPDKLYAPMATPVDVLFHRYFQSEYLGVRKIARVYRQERSGDPQRFRGTITLLTKVQIAFNDDLASVTEYRFHFDYVDAKAENAIAFIYEGFSFVGVTMPLIYKLSGRLRTSQQVR